MLVSLHPHCCIAYIPFHLVLKFSSVVNSIQMQKAWTGRKLQSSIDLEIARNCQKDGKRADICKIMLAVVLDHVMTFPEMFGCGYCRLVLLKDKGYMRKKQIC